MRRRQLQKIRFPSIAHGSEAIFSNALIWNASNAGACLVSLQGATFAEVLMIGWSRFQSIPRTFFMKTRAVFLKCGIVLAEWVRRNAAIKNTLSGPDLRLSETFSSFKKLVNSTRQEK